jgi:hypothetical protein
MEFWIIYQIFSRKVSTPLKFREDSNLNLFPNLYLPILRDFVVGPKSKVVPYVSDYGPAKFSEFWASGSNQFEFRSLVIETF